jgi:hypothetical protein
MLIAVHPKTAASVIQGVSRLAARAMTRLATLVRVVIPQILAPVLVAAAALIAPAISPVVRSLALDQALAYRRHSIPMTASWPAGQRS